MAARLEAEPEILERRFDIVEHPFSRINQWIHQGTSLVRGRDDVRAEFLTAHLQSTIYGER
jgi:hypothetical protein